MNYLLDFNWFIKLGLSYRELLQQLEVKLSNWVGLDYTKQHDYFKQFKTTSFVLNAYTSGKLLIQGELSFDKRIELVRIFFKEVSHKIRYDFFIGADEAGKGERNGALVTGALFCTKEMIPELIALGVTDSKTLKKPKLIELATELEQRFITQKTVLSPEALNKRWKSLGNLNLLLEEEHADNIVSLLNKLKKAGYKDTDRLQIVIDKFASSETRTRSTLKRSGLSLSTQQIILESKAEYYPFVAGASIIAKAEYEKTKDQFTESKNWKSKQ